MNFRIDDEVIVIAGADKGHRGKIIKIDRDAKKVIVEGAAKVWKHVRQSQKNPQGGRLSKEMPISASNVLIVDPTDGKPSRIGLRYLPDGSKERFAKRSGTSLGQVAPAKATRASK
ncbi:MULTISPECIES: 50S ribosomal protein L24 [Pirellulaceae]|uniref:Large ribosomal subunit protein uL24 n=1 Tax=Aporhodopirellula rubra TaxID=980271 RepID=A0A7W5E1I8_9BACT|nr:MULTISPECIES: 50S ribosomal protein L24 [Pirellulaceae]EMI40481.1 50S ribosomal protein L24 [Rhodopirellula sp. SWK7]MBB3208411.1 large subunit ribosomal protein L24 [Aporhodopirellula rubra]